MPETRWHGDEDDARQELWLRALVPPGVLLLAWVATSSDGLSSFFSRVFFGMWLHELGHAIAAWLTGFFAIPGPWQTITGEERSFAMRVVVGGALAFGLYVTGRAQRWSWVTALAAVAVAFVVGAFMLSERTAQQVILFGGDAGNLLLGPMLMATFHVPADHAFKTRWLRWGFVVIGAFAFADVAHVWWRAHGDVTEIPFGKNEGMGLSDPSRLVDDFGWSEAALIRRYLGLAATSLFVCTLLHVSSTWSAWSAWNEARAPRPPLRPTRP